jgi:hypothetical protein
MSHLSKYITGVLRDWVRRFYSALSAAVFPSPPLRPLPAMRKVPYIPAVEGVKYNYPLSKV